MLIYESSGGNYMNDQWVGYLITALWTLLNLGIVVVIIIFLRRFYKYMKFIMDTSTPNGSGRKP